MTEESARISSDIVNVIVIVSPIPKSVSLGLIATVLIVGLVESANVTSASLTATSAEDTFPAASFKKLVATSTRSAVPPVAEVPPKPSRTCKRPVPVAFRVIVIADVVAVIEATSVVARASVSVPAPSIFQVIFVTSTASVIVT